MRKDPHPRPFSRTGEGRAPGSLRARARGRRGPPQGGRSIDRAWRAIARRAIQTCASLAPSRRRSPSRKRLFRGCRVRRIALQQNLAARRGAVRLRRSDSRCGRHVASALSRIATAPSGSPPAASASANAIFSNPSNFNTFCSRRRSTPRRMLSSAAALEPSSFAQAFEKHRKRAETWVRPCSRVASGKFESVLRHASTVATHQFEQRRLLMSKPHRAGVRETREPFPGAGDKGNRLR